MLRNLALFLVKVLIFLLLAFVIPFLCLMSIGNGIIANSIPFYYADFLMVVPALLSCALAWEMALAGSSRALRVFARFFAVFAFLGLIVSLLLILVPVYTFWALLFILSRYAKPSIILKRALKHPKTLSLGFAALLLFAYHGPLFDWACEEFSIFPSEEFHIDKAYADSCNEAAFDLFLSAAKGAENENIVMPALPLNRVLGAYYLTLDAPSAQKMASRFPFLAAENSEKMLAELGAFCRAKRGLASETAFWADSRRALDKNFASKFENSFPDSLRRADFSNASALKREVSAWISKRSGGMSVDFGTPDTALIADVSVFSAKWKKVFDPNDTAPRTFHAPDGEVKVPFLSRSEAEIMYYGDSKFTAMALDYSEKSGACIYMVMAEEGAKLEDLDYAAFKNIKENAKPMRARIYIPEFAFERELALKDVMEKSGLGGLNSQMFEDGKASVIDKGVCLTRIKLDAWGTRVVSVSVISMTFSANMPIIFDRPFKFFIVDKETGLILFLGTVSDPSK